MKMGLEILENNENGYHPLLKFGAWRVAVANPCDKWVEGNVTFMERHMKTDEVFVLLRGEAALYIGDAREKIPMEIGKVYNVELGTWHNLCMEEGSQVLIVENDDACRENSEYCDF